MERNRYTATVVAAGQPPAMLATRDGAQGSSRSSVAHSGIVEHRPPNGRLASLSRLSESRMLPSGRDASPASGGSVGLGRFRG